MKILKFGVKSVLATMSRSKATGLSQRYNQHFDIDNIIEMINVIYDSGEIQEDLRQRNKDGSPKKHNEPQN